MNISSVSDTLFKAAYALKPSIAPQALEPTRPVQQVGGDKVTLSNAANDLDAKTKADLASVALPSWLYEFSPPFYLITEEQHNKQSAEVSRYLSMSEKLAADGEISQKDQQAIQSYMDTMMPENKQRIAREAHFMQNQGLYKEYGSIKNQYYQESLAEHGIVTPEDWSLKVRNAPDENQALRITLREKMLNDPRALELMSLLGIKKPVV